MVAHHAAPLSTVSTLAISLPRYARLIFCCTTRTSLHRSVEMFIAQAAADPKCRIKMTLYRHVGYSADRRFAPPRSGASKQVAVLVD